MMDLKSKHNAYKKARREWTWLFKVYVVALVVGVGLIYTTFFGSHLSPPAFEKVSTFIGVALAFAAFFVAAFGGVRMSVLQMEQAYENKLEGSSDTVLIGAIKDLTEELRQHRDRSSSITFSLFHLPPK